MSKLRHKKPFLLLLGDLCMLAVSLWVTLFVRYQSTPTWTLYETHLEAFLVFFVVSILIIYAIGFYDLRQMMLQKNIWFELLRGQIASGVIAVIILYFLPFDIAPKTNLFVYVIFSFLFLLSFRKAVIVYFGRKRTGLREAYLIASGKEMKELVQEVNAGGRMPFSFTEVVDLDLPNAPARLEELMKKTVKGARPMLIVADIRNKKLTPFLPSLYELLFLNIVFSDFVEFYELVFDRLPLSALDYRWFLESVSSRNTHVGYDGLKRLMDIVFSIPIGIVFLITFPFIWLAIKIEDGWKVFIAQERVGQGGVPFSLYKIRTMNVDDKGHWQKENEQSKERHITKVGSFLRKSRIDEFPQFWNLLRGDISLIGPRPDLVQFAKELEAETPYYSIRNVIKPGLSGWAQVTQDVVPHSVEETRERLAYDFYYIKHRSILLDLKIAVKTFKTLFLRLGL